MEGDIKREKKKTQEAQGTLNKSGTILASKLIMTARDYNSLKETETH